MVQMHIGKATLRDSWSIIPMALADYEKTNIDYTKFEADVRHLYMSEIIEYLRDDCVSLFNIVNEYRKQAGTGLTIATNALNFARKQGLEISHTNKKHDDRFRPFYFGGRCEAFEGGAFENIDIFDIKSAYPFAMWQSHPTGKEFKHHKRNRLLSDKRLKRSFIRLECYSHGAFPKRNGYRLTFPERFDVFEITGHELLVALEHDLIDLKRKFYVHEIFEFYNTMDFKEYVSYWFHHKERATEQQDKANYIIGKIMMNSLYGKFAQNPVEYRDYKVMPGGSRLVDGWQLGQEFGELEFHWRPALYSIMQKYGAEWPMRNCYYNVATAASITGYVRAMMLDTIAKLGPANVLYCDTDSIFTKPTDYHKLRRDGKLGSWQHEGRARQCYIGGRKLYAAFMEKGIKMATKGARLTADEVRRICLGETITWRNDAPTFSIDGRARFIERKIVATVGDL